MATVAPGSRILLRTPAGRVSLRALRAVRLSGPWSVPVLGVLAELRAGSGTAEVQTSDGVREVDAHLAVNGGVLTLCAGPARRLAGVDAPSPLLQRREDVRGRLELPFRAASVDAAGRDVLDGGTRRGVTTSVSAGGLSIRLDDGGRLPPLRTRLYLELELPGGELAPVVVRVLDRTPDGQLRVCFVDMAPADREHLVHLVFEQERREAAARRRARGTGTGSGGRSEEGSLEHRYRDLDT